MLRNGETMHIAPQASIQDGKIDISIMSRFPVIAIPTLASAFHKTIDNDILWPLYAPTKSRCIAKSQGLFITMESHTKKERDSH